MSPGPYVSGLRCCLLFMSISICQSSGLPRLAGFGEILILFLTHHRHASPCLVVLVYVPISDFFCFLDPLPIIPKAFFRHHQYLVARAV